MTDMPEKIYITGVNVSKKPYYSMRWANSDDFPKILAPTEYTRSDLAPQWQPIETAPKDEWFYGWNKTTGAKLCRVKKYARNWRMPDCIVEGSWWVMRPKLWLPAPQPPEDYE